MGHHIQIDGQFKSNKYDWCPTGFLALKFTDPKAELALRAYAQETDNIELSKDILQGLENVKEKKLEDLKNE